MRILHSSLKLAFTSVALLALSNAAQAEFCSKYQQTHSNAGQCDNCYVTIGSLPSKQLYSVTGSNGWYAEMHWVEGDSSVASGGGLWVGAPESDFFEMDLEQQGSEMFMTMQMYKNKQRDILVKARFRCVQP
jgi:hypothetical protein